MTSLEVGSILHRLATMWCLTIKEKRIREKLIDKEICRPGYIEESRNTNSLSNAEMRVMHLGYKAERRYKEENPDYTYSPQELTALALGLQENTPKSLKYPYSVPPRNSSGNPKYMYDPKEFPALASGIGPLDNPSDIAEANDPPMVSPIELKVVSLKNKNVMQEKKENDQTTPVRRGQGVVTNSMPMITTQDQLGLFEIHLQTMDETRKKDQMDTVEEAENMLVEPQCFSMKSSSTGSASESEEEEIDAEEMDRKKSLITDELLPLHDTIREVIDVSKISMDQRDLLKTVLLKATKICYKHDIAFARLKGNYEAVQKNMKTYQKKFERERETTENYREKYIYLIEQTSKERQRNKEEDEKRRQLELETIEKLMKTRSELIAEVTRINKEMYSQQKLIPSPGPSSNREQLKDDHSVIIEEDGKEPNSIPRTKFLKKNSKKTNPFQWLVGQICLTILFSSICTFRIEH